MDKKYYSLDDVYSDIRKLPSNSKTLIIAYGTGTDSDNSSDLEFNTNGLVNTRKRFVTVTKAWGTPSYRLTDRDKENTKSRQQRLLYSVEYYTIRTESMRN